MTVDKNMMKLGFALSSAGLMETVEDEIRELHPTWDDDKVVKERNKILGKATLYNDKNKKPKSKKDNKPDKVKRKRDGRR